jgi:glycosyltransferase involved in cell wall biosynthesis
MEMARFGLDALASLSRVQPQPPRLVYDAHNAEWVLQDRAWRTDLRRPRGWPGALYSMFQTVKIRRFEARLLRRATATVAVSRADEAALRELFSGARIAVVPNGVDTDAYPLADPSAIEPGLLVYTGKMDFRPNVDAMAWFAEEVLPRLRASHPQARLAIVGRDPHPRVQALNDPSLGIQVTGAVPEIQPWIARAEVVIVPLRVGGGTRLKVLEAMAMGKALVATSLGVEGLDLRPGIELEIADEPEAMARALASLLGDADRRAALGRAARERAVADYRWDVLVPHIEALYSEPGDAALHEVPGDLPEALGDVVEGPSSAAPDDPGRRSNA